MNWRLDLKQIMLLVEKSRLLSFLRWSNKSPFLPSLIIGLTNRCNMKCYMCPLGRKIYREEEYEINDIDLDDMKKLIDELSKFRFIKPRVHYIGGRGEPSLYKNFIELISYSKEKKIKWSMTTNGYTLNNYYKHIVASNCDKINISIHGDEEIHDRIVGVNGSFSKVISNLNILNEYKNKKNTTLPLIAVNCVIGRKNVEYLHKILHTLKSLPIHSITFQHLMFSQDDLEKPNGDVPRSKEEIDAIKDFIKYVKSNYSGLPVLFFPPIKTKGLFNYYNDYTYPFKNTCIFPWLALRIQVNGSVTTCNRFKLGDIKYEKVKEIWNNYGNMEFRSKLKRFGIFENCQRCCFRQYY